MAFLPLDKKFHPDFILPNKKPIGVTEIDRNNSLSRELLIYNDGSGRIGGNKANSGISSTTAKATRSTQNLIFDGTDDTILYPNSYTTSDIHTGITQVIRFRILGGVFPASGGYLMQATSSGINNAPAGGVSFNVGGSVQLTSRFYNGSGYTSANALSGKYLDQYAGGLYQWFTVAVRIDPVADTISLWQQGEAVTTTTSAGVSGANFGADEFFIASGRDSGNYSNIEVDYVGVWNRALSDAELVRLYNEPYQVLKPVTQTGYFVPSVAGGLVVQDLSVSTSLTSPSLTQHNALAVDNLAVSTTLTEPVLSQHNVLVTQNLAVATSLTEPDLTQNFTLSTNNLAVGTSLTSPALTQHHALAVDNLAVGTTLSNVTLSIAGVLAVQDLAVGTTISSPALDQHNILVVDNLAVSSTISEPALIQHNALAVEDLAVGATITNAILNTGISLLVQNLAVGTVVSVPTLTQHNTLIVDDLDVQTLLSNVSLSGAAIGCLNGRVVLAQLLDGKVTITSLLGGNTTIH